MRTAVCSSPAGVDEAAELKSGESSSCRQIVKPDDDEEEEEGGATSVHRSYATVYVHTMEARRRRYIEI